MLTPKSVFVTGANRGIGLELCKQFLKLPSPPKCIFAGCRNPDSAQDLKSLAQENPTLSVIQIDVKDNDSIEKSKTVIEAALEGEGLNLLINNAAILTNSDVYTTTRDSMMQNFEVNAVGPLMVVQTFLPLLKKAAAAQPDAPMSCNRAAIINLSTGVASITENSSGNVYPYRTSKAALNMITSNLSIDLKGDGILCSAIHPGWVKTEMGGPNALISPTESVTGLLKVMAKLQGDEGTGKFYHGVRGEIMPW